MVQVMEISYSRASGRRHDSVLACRATREECAAWMAQYTAATPADRQALLQIESRANDAWRHGQSERPW